MQLKVLVAEDSPSNAKLLRRILTSMGHDIVLVGDGLAAVEALKQHSENGKPFHAVMLDLGLPIMTGQEVLSAVRGCTASYRDVPIIVISAHALDDSRRLCKELVCRPCKTQLNQRLLACLTLMCFFLHI
ncbi:unnamed protein product [Chrysoparadoxa australica]